MLTKGTGGMPPASNMLINMEVPDLGSPETIVIATVVLISSHPPNRADVTEPLCSLI